VNQPENPIEQALTPVDSLSEDVSQNGVSQSGVKDNSMNEFYHLQNKLLVITLVATGLIALSVWFAYSLNITLNYLLGAMGGLIYLKLLGRDVERLGQETGISNGKRLAIFAGLIIIASKVQELHILPVFFGFLTYKIAIIIYTIQTTLFESK
jgi:ATP synthase protein I